jgi:GTPase
MERIAVVGFREGPDGGSRESLEELKRLVETAGGSVEETFWTRAGRKDPSTLVGRGKAQEIADETRRREWDAVVFDDELTPAQQRTLQEQIPAKVLDRTRLILDIFAQRARTREGKLQVELAQLNYLLPRITEKFGTFEQQVGGIGTRGPGERKLEVDRRHIRERIRRIRREIEGMRVHRALHRESRERVPLPQAAIVGYTNVGKSTLLNALTRFDPGRRHGRVYADDKLFATLDPTTRKVKLPGGRAALFVDTVGFIQKLPHNLVAAFHATLEEASNAQLLLHVVDASQPRWPENARVVQEVLRSLGADHVPQIRVFNKADRLPPPDAAPFRRDGVLVSARTGEGLEKLLEEVERRLAEPLLRRTFFLPFERRDLLPVVYRAGRILSEKSSARGTRLDILIDPKNWGRLEKELKVTS